MTDIFDCFGAGVDIPACFSSAFNDATYGIGIVVLVYGLIAIYFTGTHNAPVATTLLILSNLGMIFFNLVNPAFTAPLALIAAIGIASLPFSVFKGHVQQ